MESQNNQAVNSSTRLYELDVLRGIAAFAVALFHYTFRITEVSDIESSYQFSMGYLGVSGFFIISGFVIYLTLNKVSSASDFIISRFSRLYPVYWAAIILTSTIVFLFNDILSTAPSLQETVINFTMFQGYLHVPNVDGAYWSLQFELTFYFLMLLAYQFKLLSNIQLIMPFWLGLQFIFFYFKQNDLWFPYIIEEILLLEYAQFFMAGMLFYIVWDKEDSLLTHLLILACVGISFFSLTLDEALVVVSFFIIFYLFSYGKLKFIVFKPLVFMGGISYSFYLIHQNIGYILIHKLTSIGVNYSLSVVVTLVFVIIISALLTYTVEKPSLKGIRHLYTSYKNSKAIQ